MIPIKLHKTLSLASFAVLILLSGCATPPAPVSARPAPPSEKIQEHTVSRGETLFAIAWRYELDMTELAAANGLVVPYLIYSGQRLTLDTSFATRSQNAGRAAVTAVPVPPVFGSASPPGVNTGAPTGSPPVPVAKPPYPRLPLPRPALPAATGSSSFSSSGWQWPVRGAVSRYYDSHKEFKGINIQSTAGQAIVAAAPGTVVYAGSGLRGYGQLIIIKHSDKYLSAYAHNRKILVSEGEHISAGKIIGEVGGDPDNRGRLYFEIRENGKAVDPVRLLPRL